MTVLLVGVMDVLGPPVSSGLLRPLAAAAAAADTGTMGTLPPLFVVMVGESWPAPFVAGICMTGVVSGIAAVVPETREFVRIKFI